MFKWSGKAIALLSSRTGSFLFRNGLGKLELYLFSDESGVFDCHHSTFFITAGLIFPDKATKDSASRRYVEAEKQFRKKSKYKNIPELKAFFLSNQDKRSLFDLTKCYLRFAIIIKMNALDQQRIFKNSRTKQNYLDYTYRHTVNNIISELLSKNMLHDDEDLTVYCTQDQHSTAGTSITILEDAIYHDLHYGERTPGSKNPVNPPLLHSKLNVILKHADSQHNPLIRASDIIANRILYEIKTFHDLGNISSENLFVYFFPDTRR